jgi:threonine dehydratase
LPDVRTVICAIGGGGLVTGVGSAVKALRPEAEIVGAEPETAAPYAFSLEQGAPGKFAEWQASFVDGAGGQSVTKRMWQRMRPLADRSIVVTLDETRQAMRSIAEKSRTIAEGAGALSLAAALTGQAGDGPIVCVVSGGNIDLAKFAELVTSP